VAVLSVFYECYFGKQELTTKKIVVNSCLYEYFRSIFVTKIFVLNIDILLAMKLKPTDSELEILSYLWQAGPSTVRQVHEHLSATKDAGYTTTLKLMQIMQEKVLLSRTEEGRSHIYTPVVSEEETQQSLLDRFVETTFRGSAARLVIQALGNHETSADELDEIRELLKNLENNR